MKKTLFILAFIPVILFGQDFRQHDKQAHLFAGAAISTGVYHLYYQKTGKQTDAMVVALASTFAVSVIKEYADTFKKNGVFDYKDINATMLGATVVIPLSIFEKKKQKVHK